MQSVLRGRAGRLAWLLLFLGVWRDGGAQQELEGIMKLVNSIPAEERNPTIFKLNLSTSKIMFDDNTFLKMPSLVLFREGKTEEGKSAVREFRKAFPAVRDRVLGFLSGNSKPIELKLLSTMGLGAKETLPFIALLTFDFNQEGRAIFTTYRFRGEIRQHLVEEFVDQYTAGVLQPEGLLSEPVPEGQSTSSWGRHIMNSCSATRWIRLCSTRPRPRSVRRARTSCPSFRISQT